MTWTAAHLKFISPRYKTSTKEGTIQILNGKLVPYKLMLVNHRYVALILVPQSLRSSVFSHLNAGTSGGHMGEKKPLHRIRLQLFWPKLREYAKQLVKGSAYCVLYNVWINRKK